jgi:hypothetical protein
MPNNCSSILKKISYIFFLFVIVSCASLNNDIKSTPFAGKVLINQNNVEQFSFNININVANNLSIIQLKKPFYGNVLEIKVQDGKNIIFLPATSSQPFFVPKSVNRNFKYWIRQCLFSNKLDIYEDGEDIFFTFKCNKDGSRTNFSITYEDYYLKGFVEKK